MYKENDSDEWKTARVVGSWKKNSKYHCWKHLMIDKDLVVEKDFENGIKEWKVEPDVDEHEESNDDGNLLTNFFLDSVPTSGYPVEIIPPKDYGMPEVQDAIAAEIAKYKSFKAFEEVDDVGQKSIPTRCVVTDQSGSGKNESYKARICIQGDLEKRKESIRSDSPTASKDAIKLAFIIAAKVKSADIKSAYLQVNLLNRRIFVRPPKETNIHGKLWLLLHGAYGIVD